MSKYFAIFFQLMTFLTVVMISYYILVTIINKSVCQSNKQLRVFLCLAHTPASYYKNGDVSGNLTKQTTWRLLNS